MAASNEYQSTDQMRTNFSQVLQSGRNDGYLFEPELHRRLNRTAEKAEGKCATVCSREAPVDWPSTGFGIGRFLLPVNLKCMLSYKITGASHVTQKLLCTSRIVDKTPCHYIQSIRIIIVCIISL